MYISEHCFVPAFPTRERPQTHELDCAVTGTGIKTHSVEKPEEKRPLGKPRRRWEDNIKMDLQEVGGGCGDWVYLAQDRDR